MQAVLTCLDRATRIAFLLGEVFEVSSAEGGYILNISPEAFRKRLSRARASILSFMTAQCGLINPANACRCSRRVNTAIILGRVDPSLLLFATSQQQAKKFPQVLAEIRQLEESRRAAALYQSRPEVRASDASVIFLKNLLDEMPDRNLNEESVQDAPPDPITLRGLRSSELSR
jgi:hypothetical protein